MEFFDGITFDIAKQKYYNAGKQQPRFFQLFSGYRIGWLFPYRSKEAFSCKENDQTIGKCSHGTDEESQMIVAHTDEADQDR